MKELSSWVSEKGWPGAVAAIVWSDGSELSIAAGNADRESNRPMDVRDRMLAGSVGKSFAAAAALSLVESGVMKLDEPVIRFCDQFSWIDRLPHAAQLTLRLLLSHRTGLQDYIYVEDWRQNWLKKTAKNPDFAQSIEEGIRIASEAPALCDVDTETHYADSNYLIVGRLIEACAGTDYYRYLRKCVLDPLRLRATGPSIDRRIDKLVPGYLREEIIPFLGPKTIGHDGRLVYNPSWEFCGGGLVSTAADLARFFKSLFEGRIISPSLVAEMKMSWPMEFPLLNHRYGLGVQQFDTDLGPAAGHCGQFTGYRSFAFYFERSRIAVALQINADVDGVIPTFMKLAQWAHAAGLN